MKKIISILLACVLALNIGLICVYAEGTETIEIPGDINGDGFVRANDARTLLRYTASLEKLDEKQLRYADASLDGKITVADARHILRAAAGLETSKCRLDVYVKATETLTVVGETAGSGYYLWMTTTDDITGLKTTIRYDDASTANANPGDATLEYIDFTAETSGEFIVNLTLSNAEAYNSSSTSEYEEIAVIELHIFAE